MAGAGVRGGRVDAMPFVDGSGRFNTAAKPRGRRSEGGEGASFAGDACRCRPSPRLQCNRGSRGARAKGGSNDTSASAGNYRHGRRMSMQTTNTSCARCFWLPLWATGLHAMQPPRPHRVKQGHGDQGRKARAHVPASCARMECYLAPRFSAGGRRYPARREGRVAVAAGLWIRRPRR